MNIVISNCCKKSINFSGSKCLVTTEWQELSGYYKTLFGEKSTQKILSVAVALAYCACHSSNFIASCKGWFTLQQLSLEALKHKNILCVK